MSVWCIMPSIRPVDEANEILDLWRERGYKIALLRQGEPVHADLVLSTRTYLGYPTSINILAKSVLAMDSEADWIVMSGDDQECERTYQADMIALLCSNHFNGTLGVMQPTGDRYGKGHIDTAAASAWMGREWCERSYNGRGPLWNEYIHMYSDTELQHVAANLGLFWQNPHITQEHKHWTRKAQPACPDFLWEYTKGPSFEHDHKLFHERSAVGFPGSGLL